VWEGIQKKAILKQLKTHFNRLTSARANKNNCILYNWLAIQDVSVEWELTFQAPAPPFKNIWRRLHSPGWNQLFSEMNNVVSTNAIAFILFVRFCAN